MPYLAAKAAVQKHLIPLISEDVQKLPSTMTRVQLQEWLNKRRPPLTEDQIKTILSEFDKP